MTASTRGEGVAREEKSAACDDDCVADVGCGSGSGVAAAPTSGDTWMASSSSNDYDGDDGSRVPTQLGLLVRLSEVFSFENELTGT